jgi:RNA polymerase sigma-70 factor (ECF subfamily)
VREGLAEHLPHVYRLALRLTGDRHRAEDLTQETFLRAWKSRSQLKDTRAERVWLFRIAANIWKDELRQSRVRSALWSPLPKDAPDRKPTPEQCSELRESLERTLSLLNSLPVQQRTVLYLVAVEGLSAGEVGNVLGINTNAVKVNLSLARKRLREQTEKTAINSALRSGTTSSNE